jgi:glycosyltransferase involved in cell wall biosynthesis
MIDVIITTKNRFNKLKRAIAIAKRENEGTVIVVDNGSTDKTGEFSECKGITYVRVDTENEGEVKDAGIQAGKGEYFCIMPADDMISTTALAQMENVVKKAKPNLAYSYHLIDGKQGKNAGKPPAPENVSGLCVIKRAAYEEVQGYNKDGDDLDLYKRIFALGKCIVIPEFMYYYDTYEEPNVTRLGEMLNKKRTVKEKAIILADVPNREELDARTKAKLEKQDSRTFAGGSKDTGSKP